MSLDQKVGYSPTILNTLLGAGAGYAIGTGLTVGGPAGALLGAGVMFFGNLGYNLATYYRRK